MGGQQHPQEPALLWPRSACSRPALACPLMASFCPVHVASNPCLHQPAVVHPDFLDRTIGHFYRRAGDGREPGAESAAKLSWWPSFWPWRWLFRSSRVHSRAASGSAAGDLEAGPKEELGAQEGGKLAKLGSSSGRWVPKIKAALLQTPQVRGRRATLSVLVRIRGC